MAIVQFSRSQRDGKQLIIGATTVNVSIFEPPQRNPVPPDTDHCISRDVTIELLASMEKWHHDFHLILLALVQQPQTTHYVDAKTMQQFIANNDAISKKLLRLKLLLASNDVDTQNSGR